MTRHLLLLTTAGLLACKGDAVADYEVDCTGMVQEPYLGGFSVLHGEDWTCSGSLSDTFWGGDDVVFATDGALDTPNAISLQIEQDGRHWVSQEGDLDLTHLETGRGAGTYDVLATTDVEGEVAHLWGALSWCSPSIHDDCP